MEMSIWVPIISTIGGVIGGWLLGFWGTLKVEQNKRKQLEKDFKEGICAELKEVLPRFVAHYYLLNQELGKINRAVLEWMDSMSIELNGELPKWSEKIKNKLKLNDDELTVLSSHFKGSKTTAISLKKFNLSFLKENISSFSLLEPYFRRSILNIRTKIGQLNEDIDQYNFFYEKTFASGLTEENWSNLDVNIKKSYEHMTKWSRKIAEEVKELILREEAESNNATRKK